MSVHRLRDAPRFVSTAALCDELNLSKSTVEKLVLEGLPCERWGLRTRRYDVELVLAWLRERGEDAA